MGKPIFQRNSHHFIQFIVILASGDSGLYTAQIGQWVPFIKTDLEYSTLFSPTNHYIHTRITQNILHYSHQLTIIYMYTHYLEYPTLFRPTNHYTHVHILLRISHIILTVQPLYTCTHITQNIPHYSHRPTIIYIYTDYLEYPTLFSPPNHYIQHVHIIYNLIE